MAGVYVARDEAEIADIVKGANAGQHSIEVCGFRSKRDMGRPLRPSAVISTAKLSGITHYEPAELVVSAKAGTPLHEVEATLARKNQELAFEPADLSRIFSKEPHAASIGAIAAMNISGPRRILRGAARDHLLGILAINGKGERIKAGGRVMKNVTGVDLVRGLAGSWGTLAVLTEVTFKVLPKAPDSRSLVFVGLADEAAVGLLCAAMGTPHEVSGTIHIHGALASHLADKELAPANTALTAIRLEGDARSLDDRIEKLKKEFAPIGESYEIGRLRSRAFWADTRSMSFLAGDLENPVWRIACAPSAGPLIIRALSAFFEVRAVYEWSGGLIWVEVPPSSDANATEVRRVLAEFNADALLVRASPEVRASVEVFHPLPLAKMNIVKSLKKAFDPASVLNRGRMYEGV